MEFFKKKIAIDKATGVKINQWAQTTGQGINKTCPPGNFENVPGIKNTSSVSKRANASRNNTMNF